MNRSARVARLLCVASAIAGCAHDKHSESVSPSSAQLTREQAEKIALENVPGGHVRAAELEKEKGTLVWSFDIDTAGKSGIDEVLVDASTGRVVSMEHESDADEKRESEEEKEEKGTEEK